MEMRDVRARRMALKRIFSTSETGIGGIILLRCFSAGMFMVALLVFDMTNVHETYCIPKYSRYFCQAIQPHQQHTPPTTMQKYSITGCESLLHAAMTELAEAKQLAMLEELAMPPLPTTANGIPYLIVRGEVHFGAGQMECRINVQTFRYLLKSGVTALDTRTGHLTLGDLQLFAK